MKFRSYRLLLACLIAFSFLALRVLAEEGTVIYKWKDGKGVVHYVDNMGKIPEKYRDKAERIVIKKKSVNEVPAPLPPPPPKNPPKKDRKSAKQKSKWAAKAKAARKRVAELERRVKSAKTNCDKVRHQSLVMPTIANQQKAAKCLKEVKALEAELMRAKKYLEEGLPEEAHKAGVPPGWLE